MLNLIEDLMDTFIGAVFIVAGGVIGFIPVAVMLIHTVIAVVDKATWPAPVAGYEQLRSDAARIDLTASPHVMGQVAEFNRTLAEKKAANRIWWQDPFVADEWMTVEPIPVPEAKR